MHICRIVCKKYTDAHSGAKLGKWMKAHDPVPDFGKKGSSRESHLCRRQTQKILEDATACDVLLYVVHGEISRSFLNL